MLNSLTDKTLVMSCNCSVKPSAMQNSYTLSQKGSFHMERMKKDMEIKPVSNTLFYDKTEEEWESFIKEIEKSKGGFDL